MDYIATTLQWLENQATLLRLLSVAFLFIFPVLVFRTNKPKIKELKLPPSPPKLPLIGHLHKLGSLPHQTLQSLSQTHGPLMLLNLGLSSTLVVSSSKAAREIMKTHDAVFSSRPVIKFAKIAAYDKDIVFQPYGEYWKKIRRICMDHLLSAKRVQSFRLVREEEIKKMIEKIVFSSSLVNLSEILMSLTNDIFCMVALGTKYSGEETGKRFGKIIKELIYLAGVFNIADHIPWFGWLNYFNGLNARLRKSFLVTDNFLERVIEDHAQRKKNRGETYNGGTADDYQEDLVDVLLEINKDGSSETGVSFGRENIKAIILDMFVGGTDSTYAVLEWTMAELIRHPDIMEKVQKEVRYIAKGKQKITEDDLSKMNYLKSVIKETLRVHPPGPLLVPRESTEDAEILGYDVPAKTRVLINAWAIQRDPESWKEPNKFEPMRFMNSSIDYKGHDFEFIPFGAGRRGCPGIAFAAITVELALANLLLRFNWSLPNGEEEDKLDMNETFGISVHKEFPLLLVATEHSYSNN